MNRMTKAERVTRADCRIRMIADYATNRRGHDYKFGRWSITPNCKINDLQENALGSFVAIHICMTSNELKARTKRFAIDVIVFAKSLPGDPVTAVMTRQLVKSGTSVGANYRSSCRAKSRADFIAKMAIAEDEADETQYWLEVLVEGGIVLHKSAAR